MSIEEDGPVYGSGNIFADMGVPNPELAQAKAFLAIEIDKIIRARKLTQAQAAKIMGINQPRVSKIVRGRLSEIGVEALIEYLRKLGSTVEISITSPDACPSANGRSHTFTYGASSPARTLVHAVAEDAGGYDAGSED